MSGRFAHNILGDGIEARRAVSPASMGLGTMSEAAKVGISAPAEQVQAKPERPQLQLVRKVEVDRSRDANLTDFGKTTLEDRYLLSG